MKIINDAQRYLAELNINQWQDGYPNKEQITLDIKNKDSYIILADDGTVIGTTVFTTKTEPTYQNINGKWITTNTCCGVIHRLAVDEAYRKEGLAEFVFNYCEKQLKINGIDSMRIDTHKDNKGMQHILTKRGYQYCGIIILDSGDERLAFEKVV
ncbi:MAG: GNAT family N-acetyltransferase [Vicingaceae bacterium]